MVVDDKVTEFKAIIKDSSITDAIVESLFDLSANSLNIFGNDVPNMAGVAGSKTVTYTSAEKGAVFHITRVVYVSFYKNADNTSNFNLSPAGLSTADLMSNSVIWGMIKDIATELKGLSASYPHIAFHVGQAES